MISEVEGWLIGKALSDPDIVMLFEKLSERLHAIGIPIDRTVLSWPTLHPLFRAEQIFWRYGEGANLEQYYHSSAGNEQWMKSPFAHAQRTGILRLRRRLTGEGAMLDFDVLKEFSAKGFTDYLLTNTRFGVGDVSEFEDAPTGMMTSWATKRSGGFSDDDLDALTRIQRVMAVACRAAIQKRVMTNLAHAYLGPTAGSKVLSGEIQRGDGDRIPAVVWFSDLRESTRMSDQMCPDDYISLLNSYFECTAGPVIEQGGEILNFIGDGVLAIFPIENKCPYDAAQRAETAAREAMARCATAEVPDVRGNPILRFGIGLSVGEVMFGNIGVPSRLAFSGIGQVVNQVQRIESATKTIGEPILATKAFVDLAKADWAPAGEVSLDGLKGDITVYAPANLAETRDIANPGAAETAAE